MAFGNENCTIEKDYTCPYCNEHLYINPRTYANHIRWCKSNPKYEEILKQTKKNSKISGSKYAKKNYTVQCEICGTEYVVCVTEKSFNKGKYRKTCSTSCANKLIIQHCDQDSRNRHIGEAMRLYYNTENENYDYENKCYHLICKCCGKEFLSKKKDKKYCSKDCRSFARYHNIIESKDLLKRYRSECKFRFNLSTFPNEFNFDIIRKNGWYSLKNQNGASRDHMFSVKEGFLKKIDPYYISHPANCCVILNKDNISKNAKCSINFEELLERIKSWESIYGTYPNLINYSFINDFDIQIKYLGS